MRAKGHIMFHYWNMMSNMKLALDRRKVFAYEYDKTIHA
jgi:hypothetical protein